MPLKISTLTAFALIFLFYCHNCSPRQSNADKAASTKIQAGHSQPAPAPSSAVVSATFLRMIDQSSGRALVRIDSVKAYGQGTPPLAVGTELEVFLPPQPETMPAGRKFEDNASYRLILRYSRPAVGRNSPGSWTIYKSNYNF